MLRFPLIILLVLLLGLFACVGNEGDDKDTTPPANPVLRPHLGDTGDAQVNYLGQMYTLDDENNGIDTVPDEDWIRIMWEPFIDNDLSHVYIFRYEYGVEPVLVDSISATRQFYLDSSPQLIENVWYSYFIDLVDTSGNAARSDTVSYALLGKCMPFSPENGATITPTQATFRWYTNGTAERYRLVLMDENGVYKAHEDLPLATEENPLSITMPNNLFQSGKTMRWRVDSFYRDEAMRMDMGSESREYIVNIQ